MRTLCRIHECELSALGGKLLAPHEQASFAEGSFCAPFVRDVRTLDDNGVSLDKDDGTEQEVDSPAADATGLQRRPVTFLEYAVRIAQPAAAPVFVVLLARARRVVDVARRRHRRWRSSEERLFIHIRAQ